MTNQDIFVILLIILNAALAAMHVWKDRICRNALRGWGKALDSWAEARQEIKRLERRIEIGYDDGDNE
jgi:hypothetical protein